MFFEEFFECFLLLFVLFFEFIKLFGKLLVSLLEFSVNGLDFGNFFFFNTDFTLNFFFVFFFLLVEFGNEVIRVFFGLVEEVAVLDLEFVAFFKEFELSFFHEFLVISLDFINLICVFHFKDLNLIFNFFISFEFVVDLFFVVLFKFGDFLVVSFFFKLKFFCELIVLFGAVLNVRVLDFFVGF